MQSPDSRGWRTTDAEEIAKRRRRAETEQIQINNLDLRHPIYSNFEAISSSGKTYRVEIRDLKTHQASCTCVDFRTNGLGTCKHIEAVLLSLRAQHRLLFSVAETSGSQRIDIVPDPSSASLKIERNASELPLRVRSLFGPDGKLHNISPEEAFEILARTGVPNLRLSQDLQPWLEERRRLVERRQLRREYEARVQRGEWPAFETLRPLLPCQREGMLHLAFTERAILADEMGLGKSVEAIAASALLHRLGKAQRALILVPASLMGEWLEHLRRFTQLTAEVLPAGAAHRKSFFESPPFFTLLAHEDFGEEAKEVGTSLKPDILVLDEAQRIRNWNTPITKAVKHISSRYCFVLTGSPVLEQTERLFVLMDIVNPSVLGPLFRFNRDYYELDEQGHPKAPRNLEQLRKRVHPFILRRRKSDVEHELPEISERIHRVVPSDEQRRFHHSAVIAARHALARARKEPGGENEAEAKALVEQARRLANGVGAVHPELRESSKLLELEFILEECRDNLEFRLVLFSEWEDSIARVTDLCARLGLSTARLPAKFERGAHSDIRVFLSAGPLPEEPVLETVHVAIHLDQPLRSEQLSKRIRAIWKPGASHLLTVIHLVTEGTIEPVLVAERNETAELPGLWREESFDEWAHRLLRLLPHLRSEEADLDYDPTEKKEPAWIESARQRFGTRLRRIEETGNPFDPEKRRILLVLDQVRGEEPLRDLEKSSEARMVAVDEATYSAGLELVRKEILPPPVFPPRVLFAV